MQKLPRLEQQKEPTPLLTCRLSFFRKIIRKNTSAYALHSCSFLAGMEGFEPPNGGTRTRCLTTWRHPIGKTILAKKLRKIKLVDFLFRVFGAPFVDFGVVSV